MKYKSLHIVASLLIVMLVSSCAIAEKDHYVSTLGDDSDKGNARHPWKTINHAVSQVNSGTIHIRKGVYKEVVSMTNSGSADNSITIRGEKGAIIDGSFGYNFPGKGLFTIDNASYINVEGLTIKKSLTHGIMVKGNCSNIQIRNCRTEHTIGSGIYIYGEWPFTGYHIKNIIIENNEVHWPQEGFWDRNNVWQEDITLCGGIEDFVIRSNYINAYDTIQNGLGSSGICVKSGARNGEIYNNTIQNIPGSGIQLNAGKAEMKNIEVCDNRITDVTNFGILVGAIEGGPIDNVNVCYNVVVRSHWTAIASSDYTQNAIVVQPKNNINVFNNTIYRPGKHNEAGIAYGILTEKSFAGKIYNNIVVGSKDSGMQLASPDLNVTNNCLFNENNGNHGGNVITADPQFIDASNFNFALKNSSPCINTGKVIEVPHIESLIKRKDPDGLCNIGAY